MEPFSSLLVGLLHTIHRTGDTSQFTLLSHGRVHLVSLNRGGGVSSQGKMRFGWLLLVLGCVLVQKMIYLIEIFVKSGTLHWVGNDWSKGSWYRFEVTLQSLVLYVRWFIRISSNIVVRFILVFDIRVDSNLLLNHNNILLFSPTLRWLSAIEIIIFLLNHLSHLGYRGPDLLLFRVCSLARINQASSTLQARLDVVFLLIWRKLVDSLWNGVGSRT
jgi:hypothetical protein